LVLVLKCCSYISDDFLERISVRLGIQPEALFAMISRLKELRGKREHEINRLREHTNCQFFRCVLYERSLRNMPDDSVAGQRMKERLERGRNRLAKMRRRLARLHPDPSNQQIADVLGVTKGTVDSALYHLKKRGIQLADNGQTNINLN
jgi:Mn-dependent DtxR family transcriptional regulator